MISNLASQQPKSDLSELIQKKASFEEGLPYQDETVVEDQVIIVEKDQVAEENVQPVVETSSTSAWPAPLEEATKKPVPDTLAESLSKVSETAPPSIRPSLPAKEVVENLPAPSTPSLPKLNPGLLAGINKGTELRPVEQKPAEAGSTGEVSGPPKMSNALLSSLTSGVKLQANQPSTEAIPSPNKSKLSMLAEIKQRKNVLKHVDTAEEKAPTKEPEKPSLGKRTFFKHYQYLDTRDIITLIFAVRLCIKGRMCL